MTVDYGRFSGDGRSRIELPETGSSVTKCVAKKWIDEFNKTGEAVSQSGFSAEVLVLWCRDTGTDYRLCGLQDGGAVIERHSLTDCFTHTTEPPRAILHLI